MTYSNQDRYDGEWKEDYKHGKGAMKYHNGDVYEGEFSDNTMHGKGHFNMLLEMYSNQSGSGRKERNLACLKILSGLANKSTMIMMNSKNPQM